MKRTIAWILLLCCLIPLAGCSKGVTRLDLTVLPNSDAAYVFFDQTLCPRTEKLRVTPRAGFNTVELVLSSVQGDMVQTVTLTQDDTTTFSVEAGAWYRLGVRAGNIYDEPVRIAVDAEDVDVR